MTLVTSSVELKSGTTSRSQMGFCYSIPLPQRFSTFVTSLAIFLPHCTACGSLSRLFSCPKTLHLESEPSPFPFLDVRHMDHNSYHFPPFLYGMWITVLIVLLPQSTALGSQPLPGSSLDVPHMGHDSYHVPPFLYDMRVNDPRHFPPSIYAERSQPLLNPSLGVRLVRQNPCHLPPLMSGTGVDFPANFLT